MSYAIDERTTLRRGASLIDRLALAQDDVAPVAELDDAEKIEAIVSGMVLDGYADTKPEGFEKLSRMVKEVYQVNSELYRASGRKEAFYSPETSILLSMEIAGTSPDGRKIVLMPEYDRALSSFAWVTQSQSLERSDAGLRTASTYDLKIKAVKDLLGATLVTGFNPGKEPPRDEAATHLISFLAEVLIEPHSNSHDAVFHMVLERKWNEKYGANFMATPLIRGSGLDLSRLNNIGKDVFRVVESALAWAERRDGLRSDRRIELGIDRQFAHALDVAKENFAAFFHSDEVMDPEIAAERDQAMDAITHFALNFELMKHLNGQLSDVPEFAEIEYDPKTTYNGFTVLNLKRVDGSMLVDFAHAVLAADPIKATYKSYCEGLENGRVFDFSNFPVEKISDLPASLKETMTRMVHAAPREVWEMTISRMEERRAAEKRKSNRFLRFLETPLETALAVNPFGIAKDGIALGIEKARDMLDMRP